MELKKNPNVDLEKKKTIFMEIGLVLSLFIVLMAFEWTTTDGINTDFGTVSDIVLEEELIPITEQDEIKPPPPPPQPVQVIDVINIVEDDVDIEDNIDLFINEFDENAAVKIVNFTDHEEDLAEDEIFVIVEDMPGFGGGDSNKFREYIQKNMKYPDIAAENGIQGRVFVAFVVEADGRVTNVRVVRGVDPSLDREAVRVVETSPKWKPGMQRGKPVRVSFTFPIIFVLQ